VYEDERKVAFIDVQEIIEPSISNKMSVKRFERLLAQTGMKMVMKRYDYVQGLNFK
jgi:hypothetical protein